jgi:AAA domain-containing protein
MRNKGCHGASTIHSLIYKAEDILGCPEHPEIEQVGSVSHDAKCWKCGSSLRRRPRFVLNRNSPLRGASLLIVDECSMVGETVGRHLLSFGVPILVLGDPFQLRPPDGCGFFTVAAPDTMLTEIHRQGRDNPIIRMSMIVREGGRLDIGRYGKSQVVPLHNDVEDDFEQTLVGCNDTRRWLNSWQREALGLTGSRWSTTSWSVCETTTPGGCSMAACGL